jgi:hypothetical protein
LPLFSNFELEYAIRKVRENQEGFELNRISQVLPYAENINILEKKCTP